LSHASALFQAIRGLLDEDGLTAACQHIVRIESLTGSETAAGAYYADLLRAQGFESVTIDANGNVIGRIKGTGGGPSLMLNGHLDHVPTGAMTDPYSGALVDAARWGEAGQAIYGRGSCDMKCNLVSAAFAIGLLHRSGLRPAGDIILVADVEEETDSPKGVKSVVASGLRADFGLSVESTRGQVYLGHRGKVEFELTIAGRTSHASEPSRGINAVYRSQAAVTAIEAYGHSLPIDKLLGAATVTITGFHSQPDNGTAIVPDRVVMRIDRRYVRGETPATVETELRDRLHAAMGSEAVGEWQIRLINHYPLMYTPPDNPIAEAAAAGVAAVGERPRIAAWRFGVNGTFMVEAGIPTIGLGPGDEAWAHTPEEHILVSDLINATYAIAATVAIITQAQRT
jgi:putative selenium metabolism hydrolase